MRYVVATDAKDWIVVDTFSTAGKGQVLAHCQNPVNAAFVTLALNAYYDETPDETPDEMGS